MLEPIAALADQLDAVRAVSRADGSVGRIFDGHVNAQERLGTQGFDGLLGVWGADPAPGEGEPARVEGDRMYGVKTFCSGAGGLDRVARARSAATSSTWTSPTGVEIDEYWYRSAGPARIGVAPRRLRRRAGARRGSDRSARCPWFARDAVRTTATWAGPRRRGLRGGAGHPAGQGGHRPHRARRRPHAHADDARSTSGWPRRRAPHAPSAAFATHLRDAVSGACRALLDEAVRAVRLAPARHGRRTRPGQARPRRLPAPAPARPAGGARGPGGARVVRNPVEEFEAPVPRGGGSLEPRPRAPTSRRSTTRTIAALGDRTYPFGLELGASIGVLSERLARRCGRLVTLEPAPTAVERARSAWPACRNVDVRLGQRAGGPPGVALRPDRLLRGPLLLLARRAGRAARRARGADAARGHAARRQLARPRHPPADGRRGPRRAAGPARRSSASTPRRTTGTVLDRFERR